MTTTVTLQADDIGPGPTSCTLYDLRGVAFPAHVSIMACDAGARPLARAIHSEIDKRLTAMGAAGQSCNGPLRLQCRAWQSTACRHVLVLVMASPTPDPALEALTAAWLARAGDNAWVIPALAPPLTHAQVFATRGFPTLSQCTASGWGGSVPSLVHDVMSLAMLEERAGVFISYLRSEAGAAADDIHDALVRAGYRVFLDRFSGTPGRVFPQELAQAMAEMGLVVLLETPGLLNSPWTMWEKAFARRYRLGPIAVQFPNGRRIRRISERHTAGEDPTKTLSKACREGIVGFVHRHLVAKAVERRLYYETLVRAAAQARNGNANNLPSGAMGLVTSSGTDAGVALPAGVPGRLRHVRRLLQSATQGRRLLAGEHQFLPRGDRDDLAWLASQWNVALVGSASVYAAVYRLL